MNIFVLVLFTSSVVNMLDIVGFFYTIWLTVLYLERKKKKVYVTGFWKTDQIVTLDLFHFIGPAMATLIHYTYSQCHYQAWLTGLLF